MKVYKLLILCVVISCISQQGICADWTFSRKNGNSHLYKSESGTRLILKYKKTNNEHLKFNKKLIRQLNKEKKQMLAKIGITKFRVTSSSLNNKGKNSNIRIRGSYVDSSGVKNYFTEFHFYAPLKQLQILMTSKDKKKLIQDSSLSSIQQFRNKHGI